MIRFPRDPSEAVAALRQGGVARAGGTDLTELRHHGLHRGDVVDLSLVDGLDRIEQTEDGGLSVGALVTLRDLAADPRIRGSYPGLAATANGLATPQIRAQATLGGSLLQDVRCWYYRSDQFRCLKKGGASCLARAGDHHDHAPVDLGPCMAPHPSTMALPLLAMGARVTVQGAEDRDLAGLLGDGSDARTTHTLPPGALLTHVVLPPPQVGSRAAYHRTIQRSRAEWPLVEAFVQLDAPGGVIREARVTLGGIANRPLRVKAVEAALVGLPIGADPSRALAVFASWKAQKPATETRLALVSVTVADTLALAAGATPAAALPGGTP